MTDNDDDVHIAIPPRAFWLLIGAVGLGGAGGGAILGPTADQHALEACYDNSRIAIDVVAQHGDEFNKLRAEDERLRTLIGEVHRELLEATVDRYTGTDARRYQERHKDDHDSFERRLKAAERYIDRALNGEK